MEQFASGSRHEAQKQVAQSGLLQNKGSQRPVLGLFHDRSKGAHSLAPYLPVTAERARLTTGARPGFASLRDFNYYERPFSSRAALMLLSVVVPVFNRESLVGRCIESVLAQDFAQFELILVDDGSTDRSRARVQEISDPRLRLLTHECNRGAGPARNTGIDASRGEWVITLDSDDELVLGALDRRGQPTVTLIAKTDRGAPDSQVRPSLSSRLALPRPRALRRNARHPPPPTRAPGCATNSSPSTAMTLASRGPSAHLNPVVGTSGSSIRIRSPRPTEITRPRSASVIKISGMQIRQRVVPRWARSLLTVGRQSRHRPRAQTRWAPLDPEPTRGPAARLQRRFLAECARDSSRPNAWMAPEAAQAPPRLEL